MGGGEGWAMSRRQISALIDWMYDLCFCIQAHKCS